MRPPLCVCLAHPLTMSILVSLSVWCVPPSVSVCGSQMIVSLSVQCVPPKNLSSSSLQDGFHLADSTWISSVALLAKLVSYLYDYSFLYQPQMYYWILFISFWVCACSFFCGQNTFCFDFRKWFFAKNMTYDLNFILSFVLLFNCKYTFLCGKNTFYDFFTVVAFCGKFDF